MNIEDARFLFSALIQALPTVISLSLIAVFALKPERGLFKKCFRKIIFLIAMFYLAIFGDIFMLYDLENLIKTNSAQPIIFLYISGLAIFSLILFLFWYINEVNKSSKSNKTPIEQGQIKMEEKKIMISSSVDKKKKNVRYSIVGFSILLIFASSVAYTFS